MKRLTAILTAVLVIASVLYLYRPIMEVRYNTYNKTVDCFNSGQTLPEGCAARVQPSLEQELIGYSVLFSSAGLTVIGASRIVMKIRQLYG